MARIKTSTCPRMGEVGEPITELTKLGWIIMSPGQKFDRKHMLVTQTSLKDYKELCWLKVWDLLVVRNTIKCRCMENFRNGSSVVPRDGIRPDFSGVGLNLLYRVSWLMELWSLDQRRQQKVCYLPYRPFCHEMAESTKGNLKCVGKGHTTKPLWAFSTKSPV